MFVKQKELDETKKDFEDLERKVFEQNKEMSRLREITETSQKNLEDVKTMYSEAYNQCLAFEKTKAEMETQIVDMKSREKGMIC